jgi:hypothetical protein
LMTDERAHDRSPRTHCRETENAAHDFSAPIHDPVIIRIP